jgi:hypothetical protein
MDGDPKWNIYYKGIYHLFYGAPDIVFGDYALGTRN